MHSVRATQITFLLCFASCYLGLDSRARSHDDRPTLQKVAEFDLPGPLGKRFDYLMVDTDDDYLFSAHLAAGQTYVIDLRTNKVVGTILDTPGVEGIEFVPESKKLYTSNSGDNTIGVVDLGQMKVVKKLPTGKKPDGALTLRRIRNCMYPSSAASRKQSLMSSKTKSSRLFSSRAKLECRNTIPLRARYMSTFRIRIYSR